LSWAVALRQAAVSPARSQSLFAKMSNWNVFLSNLVTVREHYLNGIAGDGWVL